MQPFPPRHLAKRRSQLDLAKDPVVLESLIACLAVVLTVTMILANFPGRSGSETSRSDPTAAAPRTAGFGNPVVNWSFEQDLSGWQVIGAADTVREPQGRTSGSCALIRSRGPRPGRIGLMQPNVVRSAGRGDRFVAKLWVRSTAPGMKVTARLVGSGAKPESSQATGTTLPGLVWKPLIVDHTVGASTDLAIEITANDVVPGDALLIDEVTVRQG
jgi:hypothetical protein